MKKKLSLHTLVVMTLLLPGLVIAAPIAGPCGLCEDIDTCHMQQPARTAVEDHSCCNTAKETPATASLSATQCECGREAPPALSAESPTTVETAFAAASTLEKINTISPEEPSLLSSTRPAAPPPAPPAYLVGCAFLT
jgi:hypothetical protein